VRRVYDKAHASAEEIDDVLALLRAHDIPHYQTPTGLFGLAAGAIWVSRDADYPRARALIEQYDHAHAARVRYEYAERETSTRWPSLLATLENLRRLVVLRPLQALLYMIALLLMVALNVAFFRALSR
jgi:hypothetical protein